MPRRSQLFGKKDSVFLQSGDPLLIGRDNRPVIGFYDPVEQVLDLLFDLLQIVTQDTGGAGSPGKPCLPCVMEHGAEQLVEPFRRLQALERGLEIPFQHIVADGLAIAGAALGGAEIIGMFRAALAGGPAGGQRLAAIVAQDETAQREIFADILAGRSLGCAGQSILNMPEGFVADDRLVMPLARRNAPVRGRYQPGIDGPRQDIVDALVANLAVRQVFREGRLAFEKALHLDLGLETPAGIAFQRFLKDRGERFIPDEQLAMAAGPLVTVADRGLEHPIAVHHPPAHPVHGLLAVLLALVLRHGRKHIFDKAGIAVFSERYGGTLERAARRSQKFAEFQMRLQPARETTDIIDDDDRAPGSMSAQPAQHGLHTGPVGQLAGHIIGEDRSHVIALVGRVFAAAAFLRPQPVTASGLALAGYAGIDDGQRSGMGCFVVCFHSASFSLVWLGSFGVSPASGWIDPTALNALVAL